MPHTTHAYPFEAKVEQFAAELSTRFSAGSALRSFLLTLDPKGNVLSVVFEDGKAGWHERVRELAESGTSHLFYDPLDDGKEYIWLTWHAVEESVMVRLIAREFNAADFQPHPVFGGRVENLTKPERFPSSWGVMF
jgi:hypothetical protein